MSAVVSVTRQRPDGSPRSTASAVGDTLRQPFTLAFWRRAGYAVTTVTGLAWASLSVGAITELHAVGHGTLGLVVPPVLAVALALPAAWLERRRVRLLPGARAVGGRRATLGRASAHLLLSVPFGAAAVALAVLWAIVSLRNLVMFPFVYSWSVDLHTSWGGPTQAGAVALHVAGGLVAFLGIPWLLRGLAALHAALTRRLLTRP